jgi:peptide/nickel transport system substrate-binding protein
LERVEVVNDLTARLRLKAPDPDFLGKIMNLYILEPGSWKSLSADQAPAGTGPFSLTSYVPDQRIVFKKFPAYWGGESYLDEVVVRIIPNVDTQVLELEAGTIDLMDYALPKDVERLRRAGQQPLPFGRVNWARIAINLKTVSDVRLRQAVCYAFDRNAVLKEAYYGLGTPQYTIALMGTWAYNPRVQPYRFNPSRARALLAEAGWVERQPGGIREKDGKPLVLDLPSRGDGEWLLSTQMIQQMLLNVGIDSRITTSAPATFYNAVRTGKYDIAWWLSNAAPEPPIAALLLESHQFWNVLQVPVPSVDELVQKAGSTADQKARAQYFFELQQVHHDMALECLGHWTKQVYVAGAKVRGLTVDPMGVPLHAERWWKVQ